METWDVEISGSIMLLSNYQFYYKEVQLFKIGNKVNKLEHISTFVLERNDYKINNVLIG